jgi:hypothetical protein
MKIKICLCFFSIFILLPVFGNPVQVHYNYDSVKTSQYCFELRAGCKNVADPAFVDPKTRPMKYFRPMINAYVVLQSNFLDLDSNGNNKISMSVLEGKILAQGDQHQRGQGDVIETPNVGGLLNWAISPIGEIIKHEKILGEPDSKSVLHKELRPYYYFTELATMLMFVRFPKDTITIGEKWSQTINLPDVFSFPLTINYKFESIDKIKNEEFLKISYDVAKKDFILACQGNIWINKSGVIRSLEGIANISFKPFYSSMDLHFNGNFTIKNVTLNGEKAAQNILESTRKKYAK